MSKKFLKFNDLDIRLNDRLFSDTIIGEYTCELISMEECYERWNEMEQSTTNYLFHTCCENMMIDAGAMGNHTRFINHGCGDQLNCKTEYALIDGIPRNFVISNSYIEADEQLFISYGKEYFDSSDTNCLCKSRNCFSKNCKKRQKKL